MLFNSLPFLCFFIIFFVFSWTLKGRLRLWFSLVASYLFYGWWDWRFLGLLWFSTLFEFVIAQRICNETVSHKRRHLLIASMTVNLFLLGFFKYFNFFAASAHTILHSLGLSMPMVAVNVVLPVGISFYTFQTMSYAIDVYRREVEPERDLLKFATSIALFVHLVAGPIVRARHLLPQLASDRTFDVEMATNGFEQVLRGFFKKVVVADSLAPLVDMWFQSPSVYDGLSLIFAVIFYSFQIYCDFSGYTDIALGCAKLLGYDLGVNFNRPYFSTNFSEFWTRWHISLSSWLRDYLYIPLGGNRKGEFATIRNLLITMVLGGMWHGANWTFVVWGALHGGYLVGQRLLTRPFDYLARTLRLPPWAVSFTGGLMVFTLTAFAWIFFRAPSFDIAKEVIQGITTRFSFTFAQVQQKFLVLKGFGLIALLFVGEWVSFRQTIFKPFSESSFLRFAMAAAFLFCLTLFGTFSSNNFIYFQF
jgi:D-alanyl-lipoteichoic acid acyltransferase DltB (MBOAT superfamily)